MSVAKTEDSKLTPMLRQYFDVKKKHPDKLVLFRMGDFYETFFEDAYTSSKVLNINSQPGEKAKTSQCPWRVSLTMLLITILIN
jgi:DNA mismatch repair protein MutS